jgi:glycosyltransferase involved in cell wall biosynthesis
MRALAAHTEVLFLNDPEINGDLAEFRLPRAEVMAPNLTVIHHAFTFKSCRSGKRLGPAAAIPDSIAFHRLLRSLGIEDYVFWLASPRESLLWGLRCNHLVYDCIDPAPEAKGHNALHKAETKLARRAAAVFCTAENLRKRLSPENSRCYLLPNAAGERDFPDSVARSLPRALREVRRPIAGFIGTVDFRIDYALLAQAAERLPHISFVIVGHVVESFRDKVRTLERFANVIMVGETDAELGRDFIAAFDVGLIPFHTGVMGDGINPVKMYMYLAAGKPVVSTWMQECRRHAPYVAATRDVDAFISAIENELHANSAVKAAERMAFAKMNTWAVRADEAAERLFEAGLCSRLPA